MTIQGNIKIIGVLLKVSAYLIGVVLIIVPLVGGIDYFIQGQSDIWWLKMRVSILIGIFFFLTLHNTGDYLIKKTKKRGQTNVE